MTPQHKYRDSLRVYCRPNITTHTTRPRDPPIAWTNNSTPCGFTAIRHSPRVGFALAHRAATSIDRQVAAKFIRCIDQQRERPSARQADFAHDTLALLGVADGLRVLGAGGGAIDTRRFKAAKRWAAELLDQHGPSDLRLRRARLLASDLLDDQGRFGRRLAQSGGSRRGGARSVSLAHVAGRAA